MKKLFFGFRQKEICTGCGHVTYSPQLTDKLPDCYKYECLECYDRKVIHIKMRTKHTSLRSN